MKCSAFFYLAVALLLAAIGVDHAAAQTAPSAFTSYTRYDVFRRITGTILPDPDGSGALKYAATRNTYDSNGRLTKVETGELATWQAAGVAPANWTGFTILTTLDTTYDVAGRKLTDRLKGSDGVVVSVTQYSYDSVGRMECTAVRMNPSVFGSLPSSACTLGAQGSNGPDRIVRTTYDVAGQVQQVRKALGTSTEIVDVTYSYTPDGKTEYVIDANGNRAKLEYDGFDRQAKWIFPSTTRPTAYNPSSQANALATAGGLNAADYEQYGYDANGNRTSLRKRDGITFVYTYDALNRMTVKDVPTRPLPGASSNLASTHTRDVYYAYDLLGNQTRARFDSINGEGVTNVYDGFGRLTSSTLAMDGESWPVSYIYDNDNNRTRITHPDGVYFTYSFDGLDRLNLIENSSGQDLVALSYNSRGKLDQENRLGSAQDQDYTYDAVGRLSAMELSGGQSSSEVSWSLSRNAANQVVTDTRDNDSYAYGAFSNVARNYAVNGLNQYTQVSSSNYCSDANGNLIWDGEFIYVYDAENRLVQKRQDHGDCPNANNDYTQSLVAELRYDPLGRLYELHYPAGGWTSRHIYDGDAEIDEYWSTGARIRRFVHGSDAGVDDPLIWFEGPTTSTSSSNAKYIYADRLGSVVLVGNSGGSAEYKYGYDDWGAFIGAQASRFLYTGQAYFWELGLYYYKARMYSPTLGRFMQTDPIGYDDQANLYAYIGNDPVNGADPTGKEMECVKTAEGTETCTIIVTASPPVIGAAILGAAIWNAGYRGYRELRDLGGNIFNNDSGKTAQEGTDEDWDDLAEGSEIGSDGQKEKSGGKEQADKDFDRLKGAEAGGERANGTRVKVLPDGTRAVLRPSSDGRWTIERQSPSGRKPDAGSERRIRYNDR